MNKSTKTRYAIFHILIEVFKKNKNFETALNKNISGSNFNQNEISFISNVCLNSMRRNVHCKIILNQYIKKKLKTNEFILLSSAIVQIAYLNIKPYAAVNETVNVAKKVKVFPGFINAILKNILNDIERIKKLEIKLNDFPKWFVNELNLKTKINFTSFINTFYEHPSLHLVFKTEQNLNSFKEFHTKSSKNSAFVEVNKNIEKIQNYNQGNWWVQDFSSMLPLAIDSDKKDLDILDICAAPGGKSFQLLSNNIVILNDVNPKRISRLRQNLSRLNFYPEIKNLNGLNFPENNKFDLVILDSPCSSIGTIRKNPEILFKSKKPDLKTLNKLQKDLLQKSSKLIKNKGKIIYMVCSFFKSETIEIIYNFLEENKNFSIEKYKPKKEFHNINNLISSEGYFLTMPTKYKNYYIDGFFSAQLIKND